MWISKLSTCFKMNIGWISGDVDESSIFSKVKSEEKINERIVNFSKLNAWRAVLMKWRFYRCANYECAILRLGTCMIIYWNHLESKDNSISAIKFSPATSSSFSFPNMFGLMCSCIFRPAKSRRTFFLPWRSSSRVFTSSRYSWRCWKTVGGHRFHRFLCNFSHVSILGSIQIDCRPDQHV